jgi:iron complex outermembrane recepter protein
MKTKLFALLLFVGLMSQAAYSQTTLSGTVTDKSGEKLPGITIVVANTKTGASTDIEGQYKLELSGSSANLVITGIGYKTLKKEISLSSGQQTLDILMEDDVLALDQVVVTATFGTKSQKDSPISMSYLGAKQLATLSANSQADILRSIPGITAEGGGGEVAANIFIRGLPSGGQYQFNPLQVDGLPTLSTFGLNSSAHDVYFRNDIGIQSLEFVRGGISTLFGAGSVAGIINYNSITGSDVSKNAIQLETANLGRIKADFLSSGKLGGSDSKMYYAFSGFYRYDEGPIKTGLPTEGVQFRGNIKKVTDNGSFTLYGQFIDDKAQFYLPFPLSATDKTRPEVNGQTIRTMQTANAANMSFLTPDGLYQSPIENGASTKGGYLMMKMNQNFGDGWVFSSKIKYAKYAHDFNLFLDGAGFGNPVETQATFLATSGRGLTGGSNYKYTYVDNGQALPANALLFENRILDRQRPLTEYVGEFNLTKQLNNHTVTAGTYLARSEAGDKNITYRYLSEFAENPRLVNLTYTDAAGVAKKYTLNGLSGTNVGYSDQNINSNKAAFYLTDEYKGEKFNFDAGFRVERAQGFITSYGSKTYNVLNDPTLAPNLASVTWGNGQLTKNGKVSTTGTAIALAGLYKISPKVNVYANVSQGYFFPELRSVKFKTAYETSSYNPEKILSTEAGVKFGSPKFSGTAAVYSINLKDRNEINFINDGKGGLIDDVQKVSTSSYGLEVSGNYIIAKNFSANGNFTYQKHKYTKYESNAALVGNWLQRQPRTMGMIGLTYDNSKVDANFSTNYLGKKYTAADNLYLLDSYTISRLDLGKTFSVGAPNQKMRIGASVYNLFNTAGITEGSPRGANVAGSNYFVGRPELPRRFFLRLKYEF